MLHGPLLIVWFSRTVDFPPTSGKVGRGPFHFLGTFQATVKSASPESGRSPRGETAFEFSDFDFSGARSGSTAAPDREMSDPDNEKIKFNFGFRHALRAFWRAPNRCAPKGAKSAGQAAISEAAYGERHQHSVLGPWHG
jgi:hypothetical protein